MPSKIGHQYDLTTDKVNLTPQNLDQCMQKNQFNLKRHLIGFFLVIHTPSFSYTHCNYYIHVPMSRICLLSHVICQTEENHTSLTPIDILQEQSIDGLGGSSPAGDLQSAAQTLACVHLHIMNLHLISKQQTGTLVFWDNVFTISRQETFEIAIKEHLLKHFYAKLKSKVSSILGRITEKEFFLICSRQ